jgi:hypothetical protein
MDKNTWEKWKGNWEWILDIAKKRQWEIIDDLVIKPVVSKEQVDTISSDLKIKLPPDFIEVVTNYSGGVNFYFQIEGAEPQGEYRQVFSAGYEGIWNFEALENLNEQYNGWIESCFDDPTDDYNKVWHNKTPIIRVATGDLIAFDTSVGTSEFPVVFLSHDGSGFHGKRLGHNFTDFITRWSNIGCFGPEDWQFEPFHNDTENILELDGDKIDNWKKWLTIY